MYRGSNGTLYADNWVDYPIMTINSMMRLDCIIIGEYVDTSAGKSLVLEMLVVNNHKPR